MQPHQVAKQTLQEMAKVWQTEAADMVWLESGFDWTPGNHLVRVRASLPEAPGEARIRLSVETELLNDVAVDDPKFVRMLGTAALFVTSTYALVYPPAETWKATKESGKPTLSMFSSVYVSENLLGWLPSFFAQLTIMQPIDAEIRSGALPQTLGSGQPAYRNGGKRQAYDGILEVANEVYAPAGMKPSRWIGSPEFQKFAEEYARSDSCFGNGDFLGLTLEVPFGQNSALIRFWTDERHPQLGNGLLITTQLPYWEGAQKISEFAGNLNFLEARSWTDFPQLGCWHTHAAGDEQFVMAHSTFVPNALYRPGLVLNLAMWSAARAAWVRQTFWPDEEDLPMWKILEARFQNSSESN